jgi:hypothetical protein
MAGKAPKETFHTSFTPGDDGLLIANRSRVLIRFLLSDGTTIDVSTEYDTADLRGALVEHTGQTIAGSAVVPFGPEHPDFDEMGQ